MANSAHKLAESITYEPDSIWDTREQCNHLSSGDLTLSKVMLTMRFEAAHAEIVTDAAAEL